jgi:hypothetical protein
VRTASGWRIARRVLRFALRRADAFLLPEGTPRSI